MGGTGELAWLLAWLPISLNSSSRERDLLGDLERFPTPRTARSATGHGDNGRNGAIGGVSGSSSARCNVRKVRTFALERPRNNFFSSLVSGVGPGKGGILELPPLAPCCMLR